MGLRRGADRAEPRWKPGGAAKSPGCWSVVPTATPAIPPSPADGQSQGRQPVGEMSAPQHTTSTMVNPVPWLAVLPPTAPLGSQAGRREPQGPGCRGLPPWEHT